MDMSRALPTLRKTLKSQRKGVNRTLIFRKKKKADNAPETEKVVPIETNYPKENDFYSVVLEEYGGLLPIHSMRISFAIPYNDWCEFEKSNLYKHLLQYLQELKKRDNLHVMKALED